MTSLVLGTIGKAAFGPIGGFIGALAGSSIDAAIGAQIGDFRQAPSRLNSLKVQSSQDGAPIPIVYGKMRIVGQLIWASSFKETTVKRQVGGKGGQKVKENYYSISFALGLCEGPIAGIGQIWINGEKADLSRFEHRIYKGGENQERDSLIEAILGIENTPNYKGLAYIVFEDLPLAEFGDRIPQMAFEIFARPDSQIPALADLIESVCLIPGAGEFCYATTPIIHKIQKGKEKPLNLNQSTQKADLKIALDNLERDLPNVKNISLVAAWFGDDLRAGNCAIKPRVDSHDKPTKPREWSVAGLSRANAELVTKVEGKPAYGGSPDDISLIEAITEIKARAIAVTFNPFIMMDIAPNNDLPNPYGGNARGAYPWRGRITCMPAIGMANSAQGTAAAGTQIDSFFGNVTASDFAINGAQIEYTGPNEWSYSRFILHSAAVCKAAGGVDCFLIGSELVGLTRIMGASGQWVFVNHLIQLAAQVRAILGATTKISYGADWTEYGAYYEASTNNTYFPLDGLWSSNNIDFIGIDYYAPLSDRGPEDLPLNISEMTQHIESGEGYDYFYANEAARAARNKTTISDSSYNEPWIYRQKDVRGFWKNHHFERVNGVRQSNQTSWQAKSKPIRFMEFGVPAIDRGANRPSIFPDAKSIENGIPPFSTTSQNDSEQRNGIAAFVSYWNNNNEVSPIYSGNMIDNQGAFIWAWDARPYPAFPTRTEIWADGENYSKGHWLMGRMGRIALADILKDIHNRAGIELDSGAVIGDIDGYVIEQQTSVREAVEPLMACFGIELMTVNGLLAYKSTPNPVADFVISSDDLVTNDDFSALNQSRAIENEIGSIYFQSFNSESDYQVASEIALSNQNIGSYSSLSAKTFSCAIVTDSVNRRAIANRLLALGNNQISANIEVNDALAMVLEIGDRLQIDNGPVYSIDRIGGPEANEIALLGAPNGALTFENAARYGAIFLPNFESAPFGFLLDLPIPFANENAYYPKAFCCSEPWSSSVEIRLKGETLGVANKCAIIGEVIETLYASQVSQKLNRDLKIRIDFGEFSTDPQYAAILHNDELIDIIQWDFAHLIGARTYQLRQIVRGLNGIATAPEIPSGAIIIILDDAATPVNLSRDQWNTDLTYDFARFGVSPDIENSCEASFQGLAAVPWAPCHIRAKRIADGILLSFIARSAGSNISLDAPDAINVQFKLEIHEANGLVKREILVQGGEYLYENAAELQDFAAVQTEIKLKISQYSAAGNLGRSATISIAL